MFTCLAGHTNCSSTIYGRCEKPTRVGGSTRTHRTHEVPVEVTP